MNRIYCHISEILPPYIKKLHKFNSSIFNKYNIINIDKISQDVCKEISYLQINYEKLKMNNDFTMKAIEKEIKETWNKKVVDEIFDQINNKKTILVGSLYHPVFNFRLKIEVEKMYILDIDSSKYCRILIEQNLEHHKHEIVNGTFNLNDLDYKHIKKKKDSISLQYQKLNYRVASWSDLIHSLNPINNNIFWFASFKDDIEDYKSIITYDTEWLALTSLIHDGVEKGYIDSKPFIHEIKPHSLKKLLTDCYIYRISSDNVMINKKTSSKYKINEPFEIIEKTHVKNVLKRIKSHQINITYVHH